MSRASIGPKPPGRDTPCARPITTTELRASNEAAWRRCAQQMRPALVRTFSSMNGFAEPAPARALFVPAKTSDYAALIPWLLAHSEELE